MLVCPLASVWYVKLLTIETISWCYPCLPFTTFIPFIVATLIEDADFSLIALLVFASSISYIPSCCCLGMMIFFVFLNNWKKYHHTLATVVRVWHTHTHIILFYFILSIASYQSKETMVVKGITWATNNIEGVRGGWRVGEALILW